MVTCTSNIGPLAARFSIKASCFSLVPDVFISAWGLNECRSEFADLFRDIERRQRCIRDQEFLLEVLERDGHDVTEQRRPLETDRAHLASLIAEQLRLCTK